MVQEIIEREIAGLRESIERAFKRLRHHYPRHRYFCREVYQALTVSFNNQTFIIMGNLNLKPGMQYDIQATLLDNVTKAPVPGAQLLANKSNTIDNPAVAAVVSGKAQYVAPGQANLTSVNTWQYTDQNTGQPVTQDVSTTVQITCLQPAEVVTQDINLANESPIPASTN